MSEDTPKKVNIVRRITAVVMFMTLIPILVVVVGLTGRKERLRVKFERWYDRVCGWIIKVDPEFDA